MSLGAGESTLMKMSNAYATFVNGGKKVSPILFDRVQDRTGKTLMRGDTRACEGCNGPWNGQGAPQIPDAREQLIDPITAYQMTSMLEGVVQRGTGAVIASVGKPLAGKTGTTNDYRDAWFIGFSPDLVAGVWIGFDKPRSLGNGETGGGLAAPIFRDFMTVALADTPATPFRLPPGVRLVRIDQKTGLLPGPQTTATILEAFKPGTEPVRDTDTKPVIFGAGDVIDPKALQGLEAPASENVGDSAAPPPPPMAAAPRQGEGLGGLY
jgi:penicillin-binding protein 1A